MYQFRVVKTIFTNDNGFTVLSCNLLDEDGKDAKLGVSVVGNSLPTNKNTIFRASVTEENGRYGLQYKVNSFEVDDPKTVEDIEYLLISLKLKGLGKVRVSRIVEAFGEDTLKILDEDFDRLSTIKGMPKDLSLAKKQWHTSRSLRELIQLLSGIPNVGTEKLKNIKKAIGENATEKIKENPYLLCDIHGIRYESAEQLARSFPDYNPLRKERIMAAIKDTLKMDVLNGNLFTLSDKLVNETQKLLNEARSGTTVDTGLITSYCNELINHLELSAIKLQNNAGAIYLSYNSEYEKNSSRILVQKLNTVANETDKEKIKTLISKFQETQKITLADRQKEAIEKALENNVAIITGGPGRGKTTILEAIIEIFKKLNKESVVLLLAPTGRAAKRMSESTGLEATTIHSALGIRTSDEICDNNELEADMVIVDESSMIDMALFDKLLEACGNVKKLVFVGDVNQLPSVGAGNVLSELIKSNIIPTTILDKSFRFGDNNIYENSERINSGIDHLELGKDFQLVEAKGADEIEKKVLEIYVKELSRGKTIDDISVLTPFRINTKIGSDNLNNTLSERVNPNKPIKVLGKEFRIGDKVMQTLNVQEKCLSNGDIGYITNIYQGRNNDSYIDVKFDDIEDEIRYETSEEVSNLELAYATTIHKSQGGEYPIVIIPMSMIFSRMLKRNLLYTAVTRAKTKVYLVGERGAIKKAILDNTYSIRNTLLAWRLQNEYKASIKKEKNNDKPKKKFGKQLSLF